MDSKRTALTIFAVVAVIAVAVGVGIVATGDDGGDEPEVPSVYHCYVTTYDWDGTTQLSLHFSEELREGDVVAVYLGDDLLFEKSMLYDTDDCGSPLEGYSVRAVQDGATVYVNGHLAIRLN